MPRKKGAASRPATSRRKGAPSPPLNEPLHALPAAGKRKRCRSSSQEGDNDQEWLPTSTKRRKASPTTASVASSVEGEQNGASGNEPMDVDDAPGNGTDKPDNKKTRGLDTSLPPISDVREMFEDMVARLAPTTLQESPVQLNVATLCSGTDAPIFALGLIQEALQMTGFGPGIEFKHLFSCEIEPFKQGFIRRNLPPGTLIFRDVVELASDSSKGKATTAGGSKASIPTEKLDILFAGCSCVDYSNLNTKKPSERVPSLDRHLKQAPKKKKKRASKKKGAEIDEDVASPVKYDDAFVKDLDPALDELRQLGKGESSRTFFAAVKLIADLRPKLIILENVYSAPWDMYTDQIFPKIEYVARAVKLDSKQFYLPQTRQRGYLLAVDAKGIGEEQAARIASEWEAQLILCKRAPSSPISAFLRPADDPATIQARADMERKGPSNAEWALCSLRHADARQKLGLRRDDNPFSKKAMRNGRLISAAFPSHSWLPFWQSQVTRVIDLMDIAFASAIKTGFDLGYKTAMIDVSQNVDRNNLVSTAKSGLGSKLGVVGCITPSGMPIVTDLMRPITGTETLALQGLPVNELVISTETQAQLRDLAGNAMTVTVVGAATLAVLVAVSKTTPELLTRLNESALSMRGAYLEAPNSETLTVGRSSGGLAVLDSLLPVAKEMVRWCYCPTRPSEVFVCNDCGTTACSSCRGNPEHSFGTKKKTTCSGSSAEQGKVVLKDRVPSIVKLPVPTPVVRHALNTVMDGEYCSVVSDILTRDHTYYFDEIKVTEVVTVCYKALNSVARLVLSPDLVSAWYIYIAPWHPSRFALSATFDLDQPIARGQILGEFCEIPQWSVWTHGRVQLTLDLAKADNGALVAGNLSFAPNNDAASSVSLLAWKRLVEWRVCGTYFHRPNCGTAGNALHVKPSSQYAPATFMMWDSASLRDADKDHFVWTDTVRRMEPHEYRETLLHAEPKLSWDMDSDLGSVDVFWPGYWSSPSQYSNQAVLSKPLPVQDAIQVQWGSTKTIRGARCHTAGDQPKVAPMPILATIEATFINYPASAAQLSKFDIQQTGNRFFVIPATGRDVFLKMFAFLSRELRRSRMPAPSANFAPLPHLEGEWVPVEPCQTCSVTPPEITVYTKKDQNKEPEEEDGRGVKAIIEDPDEAALFERQYQDLPRAVAVAARLSSNLDNGTLAMDMRLMLQPKTLASRALAYLLQAHRTTVRGRLDVSSNATTSFTVTLDYAPSFSVTGFTPFGESVRPCGREHTAGINLDIRCELPLSGPPRFCRTRGRGRNAVREQYKLRPSQQEAVNWMLQRELAPLDFIKSEIEEEVVGPLNLRVLGKAEWASRFPFSSRGGVIAHDVGYGKTVVTLALLDYMRGFDQGESVAEREEKVDAAWSEELPRPFEQFGDVELKAGPFFLHLSATLIIVPRHITNQWQKEVEKFLGLKKPRVLVVKTANGFHEEEKLKDLQQAEIIIVSSSLFGDPLLNHLATVMGSGRDGLSGRTLEAWYRAALRNYRMITAYYVAGRAAGIPHSDLMQELTKTLIPGLVKKQQGDIDELVKKRVPDIDRTFYNKRALRKAAAKKSGVESSTAGQEAEVGAEPTETKPTETKPTETETTETQQAETQQAGTQQAESQQVGTKPADPKPAAPKQWEISWLHACSFARVIWDECSYDDKDHVPLFVANSVANAKWLISGTPKLFGLEHICNIASAFGIHVARPEPRIMPGLPAVTKGPQLSPMSKSEEFHVFSSEVKSVTLAHERHSVAQGFVAAYFRANALDAEVDIEVEEQVRPVAMSAADSVRYHMLNQEVIDAGYDYAALPAHARGLVPLKGIELTSRDSTASAKMLLGLLSCGLGQTGGSIEALKEDLAARSKVLGDQLKLLWDKAMWLWRWIRDLDTDRDKEGKKAKDLSPVQDTLKRVEIMCESLGNALEGDGDFEDFGGKEMFQREAAIVAGLGNRQQHQSSSLQPEVDSLRAAWAPHFGPGWTDRYHEIKALYTWLDFFKVEPSALEDLSGKQLRLLAEDICWLRYKADPDAASLNSSLSREHVPSALRSQTQSRTAIPEALEERIANDKRVLASLDSDGLVQFISAYIKLQRKTMTWKEAKKSFDSKIKTNGDRGVKAALQERLAELNLKHSSGYSIDKLKEVLWRHEEGLNKCEQYRDGRAPPDRNRDFELALGSGGKIEKQMETAHEELKRTLVHLAKTVEDLRATALEARFVPEYASLVTARDRDSFVARKTCCGCRKPLRSASLSFLVVACGHFLCGDCKSTAGSYCPVQDCPAFIRQRPVLWCSQVPRPLSREPCAKAECITKLIMGEIPRGDFVVVFAQYGPLIEALAKAFGAAKLGFINLAAVSDDKIASQLEEFKKGKAGQILLLDIDSETSAGSNLTIATHVIFANPYVHHDEEHQARTVRQARGRCIRTGQTEKVHVYHFMVSGTIEEETLRELARDSPAVQEYFENLGDVPWWLDGAE